MADITPLFESTSLSTPKAGPPRPHQPQAPGDALAAALLAGILTDLSALKEQGRLQGELNQIYSAELLKLRENLGVFADLASRLSDVVHLLDGRLAALDGKRSFAP